MYLVNKANKVSSGPFLKVTDISFQAGFYPPAGPGFTRNYVGYNLGPTASGRGLTLHMTKRRVYSIHPVWIFVDGEPTRGDMECL